MSLAYNKAAIVALLVGLPGIIVKEVRSARNGFHALNIELEALQKGYVRAQGEEPPGPVAKGRLLGAAMEKLQAAGYPVEDLGGYRGRDGTFQNWPHLRIIEPGTGVQAGGTNPEVQKALEQSNKTNALLLALLAKQDPELAAQLGGQVITGQAVEVPATDNTETPELHDSDIEEIEGEDGTFGEEASA